MLTPWFLLATTMFTTLVASAQSPQYLQFALNQHTSGERYVAVGAALGIQNYPGRQIQYVEMLMTSVVEAPGLATLVINGTQVGAPQQIQANQNYRFHLPPGFVIGQNLRSLNVLVNGNLHIQNLAALLTSQNYPGNPGQPGYGDFTPLGYYGLSKNGNCNVPNCTYTLPLPFYQAFNYFAVSFTMNRTNIVTGGSMLLTCQDGRTYKMSIPTRISTNASSWTSRPFNNNCRGKAVESIKIKAATSDYSAGSTMTILGK